LARESRSFSAALLASLGEALAATSGWGTDIERNGSVLALVPLTRGLPGDRIRDQLGAALSAWGSTAVLSADSQVPADSAVFGRRLDELEHEHEHVLLHTGVPDPPDRWT